MQRSPLLKSTAQVLAQKCWNWKISVYSTPHPQNRLRSVWVHLVQTRQESERTDLPGESRFSVLENDNRKTIILLTILWTLFWQGYFVFASCFDESVRFWCKKGIKMGMCLHISNDRVQPVLCCVESIYGTEIQKTQFNSRKYMLLLLWDCVDDNVAPTTSLELYMFGLQKQFPFRSLSSFDVQNIFPSEKLSQ